MVTGSSAAGPGVSSPSWVWVILAGVAALPPGVSGAPGSLALLWLRPRRAACHCSDSAEPTSLVSTWGAAEQ